MDGYMLEVEEVEEVLPWSSSWQLPDEGREICGRRKGACQRRSLPVTNAMYCITKIPKS
jgi:hypothetical protein